MGIRGKLKQQNPALKRYEGRGTGRCVSLEQVSGPCRFQSLVCNHQVGVETPKFYL